MEEEVKRTLSPVLLGKIYDSLMTIATAIEPLSSKDNLMLGYNGGKDTCVMMYLVHEMLGKNTKSPLIQHLQDNGIDTTELMNIKTNFKIDNCRYAVFEFKIGEEFPEIVEFLTLVEKEFDITVEKYENKIKTDLETLVNEQNITTVVIGNRRTDPYSEHLLPIQKSSEGWPDFIRVHPILDWEYSEIWRFIHFFKIKTCSLYEQGYTSLGKVHNTRKNPYLIVSPTEDGTTEYLPAWFLEDETKERESRIV